jgi:hypothetical protein
MPRGVYDRSKARSRKKKSEETKVATAAAPVVKTGRGPGRPRKSAAASHAVATPAQTAVESGSLNVVDMFNILGSNVTTLTESFSHLDGPLKVKIGEEISSSVDTISRLRQSVFQSVLTSTSEEAASTVSAEYVTQEDGIGSLPTPSFPVAPVLPVHPGTAFPTG